MLLSGLLAALRMSSCVQPSGRREEAMEAHTPDDHELRKVVSSHFRVWSWSAMVGRMKDQWCEKSKLCGRRLSCAIVHKQR
jgi:hypothetical protein